MKSMEAAKDIHSFQIDDIWQDVNYFDGNGYARTADYECVMITGSAYVMVDASYPSPDMGKIAEIAYKLDEKKAEMGELFGPVFDYDGNGRIIIAFSRLGESTLGYVCLSSLPNPVSNIYKILHPTKLFSLSIDGKIRKTTQNVQLIFINRIISKHY